MRTYLAKQEKKLNQMRQTIQDNQDRAAARVKLLEEAAKQEQMDKDAETKKKQDLLARLQAEQAESIKQAQVS
jgi:hypothetical protein